jgi:NADH-ubiquinone oxidoreductase chain 6
MELEVFLVIPNLKYILCFLSAVAGVFVISTKNAIISVFNLIVLYILVAFYLIYIGITYLGISYIVVYIGAIAILFLFVIMMIDVEVVDRKNNNYLPLLLILLGGFLYLFRNILFNLGNLKIKSLLHLNNNKYITDIEQNILFDSISSSNQYNSHYLSQIYNSDYYYDTSKYLLTNYDLMNLDSNINIIQTKLDNNMSVSFLEKNDFKDITTIIENLNLSFDLETNHYLLITPNWDSAVSRISQISAIGNVLYSTYYSFIYIVSVILLLAMVGAIILTTDHNEQIRTITIVRNKNKTSNILAPLFILIDFLINMILNNNYIRNINIIKRIYSINNYYLYYKLSNFISNNYISRCSVLGFFSFSDIVDNGLKHSEDIIGNLIYYIISNIIIGLLLLLINSSFSLSVKYLDKGGGFECGFTSFLQTRERYNIIFYRVSLLFLVFDLEIILAFPYPAIYQKDQATSKNNVLAFLYILVIGFIYELKEGALNIVKTPHHTEIKVDY